MAVKAMQFRRFPASQLSIACRNRRFGFGCGGSTEQIGEDCEFPIGVRCLENRQPLVEVQMFFFTA
jgi:hypothetical protein